MRSPFFWPAIASLALHAAVLWPQWGWRPPQVRLPGGTRSVELHLLASPYLRAAPRHVVQHRQNPETPRERPTEPRRDTAPPLPRRAEQPVISPLRPQAREVSLRRPTIDVGATLAAEADVAMAKRQPDLAERVPQPAPEQPPPLPIPASDAPGDGRHAASPQPVNSDVGEHGVRASDAAVASCVPQYPRLSRIRGEEGTVVLEVEVRPDGSPATIRVVRSSGYPRLDRAAVQGMRKASFSPAVRGGQPTGDTVRVAVTFELRDRHTED